MTTRQTALYAGVFAALLATLPSAHAWGPVGHRAVGGVADRLLNDAAKAQVAALLANDLDKSGQPSGRTTLEAVSTWADEIRSTSENKPLRHYDDIPACGAVPSTPTWCDAAHGECASQQIEQQKAVLADPSQSALARNEALKWLVHLVGDIHQPLHAATNVYVDGTTDDQGNATDRGGNDVPVALSGAKTRGARELHGVWDNDLVNLAFGRPVSNRTGLSASVLTRLASAAAKLPPTSLNGSALDWAKQSNQLARKVAYKFDEFACYEPVNDTVTLSAAYIGKAKQLIPNQIELAGARLANLLNSVLGH